MPENAWIITPGVYADVDLAALGIDANPKRVMVYRLSDIGRYLLNTGSVEVEGRLVGCECLYRATRWQRIKLSAARVMRRKSSPATAAETGRRRLLVARDFVRIPVLQDLQLARHIDRLRSRLHPFDPVVQEIGTTPIHRLEDIRGVCEDEGGHRTYIALGGDLETKRRYILDNLLKPVPITLSQARIADGLYDMRGLHPERYRSAHHHRLLKFHVNGRFFVCLANRGGKVEFWADDVGVLHQLLLLQQALETSPVLRTSMEDCLRGKTRALRLMINQKMDIDYSRNRLPQVYRDLFASLKLDSRQQQGVIRSLNDRQMGVSFSFVPQHGFSDSRAVTSISVMHDVKALEAFRQDAPALYAEINRKATMSEAGTYYLLEAVKGHSDEAGL